MMREATVAIRNAMAPAAAAPPIPRVKADSAAPIAMDAAISMASCTSISMTSLCASSTLPAYSLQSEPISPRSLATEVIAVANSLTSRRDETSSPLLRPLRVSSA